MGALLWAMGGRANSARWRWGVSKEEIEGKAGQHADDPMLIVGKC